MRLGNIAFIVFLTFLIGCTPSDENSPSPETVFVKYYGDQNTHKLYDIVETDEGEFILFGTRKVDGDVQGSNFYLVRTDAGGNMLADAVIDIDSTEDIASRIKIIDGGFLIIGSIANLNSALIPQARKLFWARLDSDFSVINSLTVSALDINAGADSLVNEVLGTDIILTANDSILALGVSDVKAANESTKPNNLQKQMLVVKSDIGGNVSWNNTTGYSNSDESAIGIFEEEDGGITLVGSASNVTSNNSHGGVNVAVTYFNRFMTAETHAPRFGITVGGELNWNETPVRAYRKSENSGHIIIAGTSTFGTSSFPFIMTVSEGGQLISADTLTPNFDGNAFGNAVTRTLTNEYVVVGTAENWRASGGDISQTKGDEILFLRADQFSSTENDLSRNYGTQSGNDEANAVLCLSDGAIVVGGTIDFGSGVTLFTLLKMNDQGELKD